MDPAAAPRRRWRWWHRQTPTTRRVLRTGVAVLVTGLAATGFGISTATTQSSLGPHTASYAVTLDRQVTLDVGPLGAVMLDSPLPGPLGVAVVVHEIPSDLAASDSPLPGLLADLDAYGQLFGQPQAAVADAAHGLVSDALGRTAVAWSVMLVLLATGRLASRGRLREELKGALRRPGVAALGSAVVLAAGAAAVVPALEQPRASGYSPAVLDGTPLEGARITGRLADVVATYGQVVKDAYQQNEDFYAAAADGVAAGFAADDTLDDPPAVTPGDGAAGPDDDARAAAAADGGAADDGPGADGAAEGADPGADGAAEDADGAGEGATPGAVTAEDASPGVVTDPVTLVVVSDLHCNIGMASVIAAVVEQTGADAVLDGGDTVMSGTSAESYCVDAFAGALPADLPVVVSTGNHDSVTTADQERRAGWTVLAGEPVDVAGVRVLGDTDPTLTAVGAGTRQERTETVSEMGERLAGTACTAADDGDPVDLLLVHNPRAGTATLERGCAPLQISGHWHRTVGPEPSGAGVLYVSTSSGGAAGGGATLGPLSAPAEVTVVRLDPGSGAALDYRWVVVDTGAGVNVGAWTPFPAPAADGDAAAADEPAPGGAGTGEPGA
ncbi:metallophosphoesterase [Georgenia sp. TF02-10]|uniref:metallophosphoesterase family protein n=1 Tax=Georgenia sp. TF02-10 TaxID=2917725 RepID=UPI001FA7CEE9|nr:metallophosphoesterase [Georgenia sp. TF02-10]UNX53645.1 metallophosphoesterase [Georgenia sp. TF02-10]